MSVKITTRIIDESGCVTATDIDAEPLGNNLYKVLSDTRINTILHQFPKDSVVYTEERLFGGSTVQMALYRADKPMQYRLTNTDKTIKVIVDQLSASRFRLNIHKDGLTTTDILYDDIEAAIANGRSSSGLIEEEWQLN